MENTNVKTQLFLKENFIPTHKDLKSANADLGKSLIEQSNHIVKGEKLYVTIAMICSDIIYFKTTKGKIKNSNTKWVSEMPLPLFTDVEEELKKVVKNSCTFEDELNESLFLKMQSSFQSSLRLAFLVVGNDTGYEYCQRRDSNKKADRKHLKGEQLALAKRQNQDLVFDCFYDASKTFPKTASKTVVGEFDNTPNYLQIATRENINDSYSKFIVGREVAKNGAEFVKQGTRETTNKGQFVIPENRKDFRALLFNFETWLTSQLPEKDENNCNHLSLWEDEEADLIEKNAFVKDGKSGKNQPTISELLVKLNNTVDVVINQLGNTNKLSDITDGDLNANKKAKADNLINARLNQEQAQKLKKSA